MRRPSWRASSFRESGCRAGRSRGGSTQRLPGLGRRRCSTRSPRKPAFLLSQLRDDRDPMELCGSAAYTFLNERLARKYYGVAGRDGLRGSATGGRCTGSPSAPAAGPGQRADGDVDRHGCGRRYTTPSPRAHGCCLHIFRARPALPNGFPGAQPVKPELPITPQTADAARRAARNATETSSRSAMRSRTSIRSAAGARSISSDWWTCRPRSWTARSTNGVVELRRAPAAVSRGVPEDARGESAGLRVRQADRFHSTVARHSMRARNILRAKNAKWSAIIAGIVSEN